MLYFDTSRKLSSRCTFMGTLQRVRRKPSHRGGIKGRKLKSYKKELGFLENPGHSALPMVNSVKLLKKTRSIYTSSISLFEYRLTEFKLLALGLWLFARAFQRIHFKNLCSKYFVNHFTEYQNRKFHWFIYFVRSIIFNGVSYVISVIPIRRSASKE